jgi:purine-nucleoside/S-methyl-5'-thioadenosine phosphorylase / adenosine deaminase
MIESSLLKRVPGIAHGFGSIADERPVNVVTVKQVHGVRILEPEEVPAEELDGYDTVLTDRPGIAVAVKTADCQPILLVEPEKRIVAAVHAGWKGTRSRVVQVAVRRIVEKGGKVENLVCSLGPNMRAECFEVEADVANDFESEFPGWPLLTRKSEDKWLLDVSEANRRQLIEMSVPEAHIDRINLCTHCHPDLFWSYRRDGEAAGRMVSFIRLV